MKNVKFMQTFWYDVVNIILFSAEVWQKNKFKKRSKDLKFFKIYI